MKPPDHLRGPTKRWFADVCRDYVLEDHHIRLLTLACEAFDRGQQAREDLATHGTVFTDRFGSPRARPEVAIERDSRIAFARLCRELDLSGEPTSQASRPPTRN
jgi:P27 family predicted phage terminase small subunit